MENQVIPAEANQNTDDSIKVFGAPTTTGQTPEVKTETEEPKTDTAKTEAKTETNANQEAEKLKEKETKTEAKAEPEESKTEIKGKKEEKKTDFKVSFDKEPKASPENKEPKQETKSAPVTEEIVLKFLKENNIEVESLSDLSKKDALPESVEKFKKYHEETGRGHKDYFNSQRDWSKETKDDTIKEFYKYEYPNMSDEDIETQLELIKVTEDDTEMLEERELKKRKLDYSKEYQKALGFMTKKSKEFKTSLDNTKAPQKQLSAEEISKIYKPYWDARDESLNKLNEVNLSIDGVGDIKLNVTDEHKRLISENTQTQEAYFQRWQDKKGIVDTDKSTQDVLWSIPEIRQELITGMLEQAHALILDSFSKENRNVNLGKTPKVSEKQEAGSLTILSDGEKSKTKMGSPLF